MKCNDKAINEACAVDNRPYYAIDEFLIGMAGIVLALAAVLEAYP